jgi:hypothetical protein
MNNECRPSGTGRRWRSGRAACLLAIAAAMIGVGCATADQRPATSRSLAPRRHFVDVEITEVSSSVAAKTSGDVRSFLGRILYGEDGFRQGAGLRIEIHVVRWEPEVRGYSGPPGHARLDLQPVRPSELTVDARFTDATGRLLAEQRFVGQGAGSLTGAEFDEMTDAANNVAAAIAKYTVDNFR